MSGDFGPLRADVEHLAKARQNSPETPDTETPVEAHPEQLGDYSTEPYESYEFPGKGESGPRCGEWKPAGVCESCGHLDLTVSQCGRRRCPQCWHRWARGAAVRAATRIQAWRHTQQGWRQQAAHAVVSPPEGTIQSTRQFFAGKRKAAELAKSKGWRGFAVIAHPWRATGRAKEEYEEVDPDVGLWVWLRREKTDIHQWIYWSPHYHIIGATGADMEPAEESDNWVYSFIRSCKPYGGITGEESHEDVYGLFRYLLSHTGWPEESTKPAVAWYGMLGNNKFVENATEEWQAQKPSEGVLSALRRHIEEVAGVEETGESDGESGDEKAECSVEDCGGVIIDVWDIKAYLRQQEPPPDVREKMKLAWQWRLGEVEPPPGAKRPQSEQEARESWELVLNQ